MYPVLFRIGSFEVDSFWVMVFLGFTAAALVARSEFRRDGLDPNLAWDLLLYSYIGGLLGARLFLLFTAWDLFVQDPFVFLFSGSGWVFQGGLIGGGLAVLYACRRYGAPIPIVCDAAAMGVPLAQAIGRIGCQLAGDGDYGIPTSLPWGMSYPHGVVPTEQYVHPTPIYETILYLAIFFFLRQRRGRGAKGEMFGWYLILGGLARFAVEFLRRNPQIFLGLTLAQWIGLASVPAGLVVIAAARSRAAAPSPA